MTGKFLRRLAFFGAAAALAACVPVTEIDESAQIPTITAVRPDGQPFALLDAGAAELESLHFKVRAYGQENARLVSESAERDYQRIMVDTNLFSFQQRALYQIVVYATQAEYRQKTGQPEWSGGCSVGSSIFTYAGPQMTTTIAHEMTHLIWFEFMQRQTMDHRWVNEGLAVYEEIKAAGPGRGDPFALARGALKTTPLTLDQLIHLVPATEKERTVTLWYAESASLVEFMIERGGRMSFSTFLNGLREGRAFDDAVRNAFLGQWATLAEVYAAWERSQR
jgi:hypothetical protein